MYRLPEPRNILGSIVGYFSSGVNHCESLGESTSVYSDYSDRSKNDLSLNLHLAYDHSIGYPIPNIAINRIRFHPAQATFLESCSTSTASLRLQKSILPRFS